MYFHSSSRKIPGPKRPQEVDTHKRNGIKVRWYLRLPLLADVCLCPGINPFLKESQTLHRIKNFNSHWVSFLMQMLSFTKNLGDILNKYNKSCGVKI